MKQMLVFSTFVLGFGEKDGTIDYYWLIDDPCMLNVVMKQMQEVAGERGGYLHGRGGTAQT